MVVVLDKSGGLNLFDLQTKNFIATFVPFFSFHLPLFFILTSYLFFFRNLFPDELRNCEEKFTFCQIMMMEGEGYMVHVCLTDGDDDDALIVCFSFSLPFSPSPSPYPFFFFTTSI